MRILLILSLFLLGCADEKFTCPNSIKRYGENIRWAQDHIVVYLNPNMSQWRQATENAIEKLNEHSDTPFVLKDEGYYDIHIYASSDWASRSSSEQAFAQLSTRFNVIQNAVIVFNTYNFQWYWMNGTGVEVESVMLHELGHALGLNHFGPGIMTPTMPQNTSRVTLSKKDIAAIECQNLFNGRPKNERNDNRH